MHVNAVVDLLMGIVLTSTLSFVDCIQLMFYLEEIQYPRCACGHDCLHKTAVC